MAESSKLAVLAVDTSGFGASAALRTAGGEIHEGLVERPNSHNEELGGLVAGLLHEAGLAAADLDALVIGAGPGSFTGLRIGYSFMKGLAFAHELPLTAVSTLKACAYDLRAEHELIVAAADARRGELFVEAYRRTAGGLEQVQESSIMNGAELDALLQRLQEQFGVPADQIGVVAAGPLDGVAAEVRTVSCIGRRAIEAAADSDSKEFNLLAMAELEPNYLRPVAARTIAERGRVQKPAAPKSAVD